MKIKYVLPMTAQSLTKVSFVRRTKVNSQSRTMSRSSSLVLLRNAQIG